MTFYSVAIITTHYDHNCDHDFPSYAFLARCVDNHLTTLPTDCKSCESCESNLWFIMKWHLSFSSFKNLCVQSSYLDWLTYFQLTCSSPMESKWLSMQHQQTRPYINDFPLSGCCCCTVCVNWDHSNLMDGKRPF
jgi:hypothetical protein